MPDFRVVFSRCNLGAIGKVIAIQRMQVFFKGAHGSGFACKLRNSSVLRLVLCVDGANKRVSPCHGDEVGKSHYSWETHWLME